MMRNMFLKTFGTAAMTILMTATFAQISAFAQEEKIVEQNQSAAQTEDELLSRRDGNRRSLKGTWDVQVTVRNCQTGAAIRTFPAIATFSSGGTALVSESGIPSALKTPAHGVWSHSIGYAYRFKTKAFNFDAGGNFTGWIIINNEVTLNYRANEFTSIGAAEVYAPNGTFLSAGCSTLAATRFEQN